MSFSVKNHVSKVFKPGSVLAMVLVVLCSCGSQHESQASANTTSNQSKATNTNANSNAQTNGPKRAADVGQARTAPGQTEKSATTPVRVDR